MSTNASARAASTLAANSFREALLAVGGEVHLVHTAAEAQACLQAVLEEAHVRELVHHAAETLAPLQLSALAQQLQLTGPHGIGPQAHREHCARADAGLTGAIAGIAATGTLVLAAAATTPRSTSLLPPLHVALLHSARIVPDIAAALLLFPAQALPSQIINITGPSRTGDIEHDLTTGVHGPARLVVILLHPESEHHP